MSTDRFETKPGVELPKPEDRRPKRFYKEVMAGEANPALGEGYAVLLDGRPVRTPAKKVLLLPTAQLARLIAEEWAVQGERVDPSGMTMTRLAFVTLDRDAFLSRTAIDEVAKYAETDLACYRAETPPELAAAQAEAWDGPLDWARTRLKAEFSVTKGLFPIGQPPEAIRAVRATAESLDAWRLTALAHATALAGSAVIALMLLEGEIDGETAFRLSTVDETHQAERWGADEEASERLARLREEMIAAGRFIAALAA